MDGTLIPLRIMILEQDAGVRDMIRQCLLSGENDAVVWEGPDTDTGTAVALVQQLKPDLLFLNVLFPERTGFDILSRVSPGHLPAVVFLAPDDRFALQAFSVRALDYIVVPSTPERIRDACGRARELLALQRQREGTAERLTGPGESDGRRDRVLVKSRGRFSFVRTEDISWVEAQGDYVCLHADGRKHLLRERMARILRQLPSECFLRIHRSAIVNIDRVREMQHLDCGEYAVILLDGTRLTLSRSYRGSVLRRLTTAA